MEILRPNCLEIGDKPESERGGNFTIRVVFDSMDVLSFLFAKTSADIYRIWATLQCKGKLNGTFSLSLSLSVFLPDKAGIGMFAICHMY